MKRGFISRVFRASLWVVVSIVLLFVVIAGLIQVPAIQNKIVGYLTTFVSDKTHTRVAIKHVRIAFPKSVVLEGLFLEDLQQDTLLFVGKAKINISLFGLFSQKVSIGSFALNDVYVNLHNTSRDSTFNYTFLLKAFEDTTTRIKTTPSSPWSITLDRASLSNIRGHYNDNYRGTRLTAVINRFEVTGGRVELEKWRVEVKKIALEADAFSYTRDTIPTVLRVFDAGHQFYSHLSLEASGLNFSSDSMVASIRKLNAIDRNNFSIRRLETDFRMDAHSISAHKLHAEISQSSIDADLQIHYSSINSLRDSLPFLILKGDLKEVHVQNADILYFYPPLIRQTFFQNTGNTTTISGSVTGRINDLAANNLVVKTGIRTIVKTNLRIEGLPAIETARFYVTRLEIISGKQDIAMMAGPKLSKSIDLPEKISLQAVFKGTLSTFETTIGLSSSFGAANLFVALNNGGNYNGRIGLTRFNLGRLLKISTVLGPITMTAGVKGHGFDPKSMEAKIDATVSQFFLDHYNYHNLTVDGFIRDQHFEVKANLSDTNVQLDFDGKANLTKGQERYQFRLNLHGADLAKLHLTKEDVRIGFTATADLTGGSVNNLAGNVKIEKVVLVTGEKTQKVDSLFYASLNEKIVNPNIFSSPLIGLSYSGSISPKDLTASIRNLINSYFPLVDSSHLVKNGEPSNFTFELHLRNHPIFQQVLAPRLTSIEPAILKGHFNSEKNDLQLSMSTKKILYGTTEITDFALDVSSDSSALRYKISGASISNAQIKLDNFLLEGKLADKTLYANVSSITDDQLKKLQIRSKVTRVQNRYRIVFEPDAFYLMNDQWVIAEDHYIELGSEGLLVHHLFLNHAESQVNLSSAHDKFNDDLTLVITDFKLEEISRIIEKDTSLVKGVVNGKLLLKRVNSAYGVVADAKITNLVVREIPVGDVVLSADNPVPGRFDFEVNLTGNDNRLSTKGHYIPGGGDQAVSLKTTIESLSMKTVEAFSMGQIKETSGRISGELFVQGAIALPEITGELTFNEVFINPAALNTRLELKHETIQLKVDGIHFAHFTISDVNKNSAIVEGSIQMKQYKDFIFNLRVNMDDFLLFNTTVKDNKLFFGRMIIDSKIDIKGPLALPVVTARVKIKRGSNFTFVVPEEKISTYKGEDVVEFVHPKNLNSILYEEEKKTIQRPLFTGVDLTSVIEIDKEATLRLLLDPSSSDSLVTRGEAALSLTIDRSGKISLTGAYNLNEGSYQVSLQSVIKKKFEINPGSTIIWNGDPLDAEISINATYSVRASPIDLVADQMSGMSEVDKSAYKQTYPFWVQLKLRGAILRPEIGFEIQLPPKNKGILGGAVDAKLKQLNDDPSALNKQVFALLVLGRFIQENPLQSDANSGVSNVVRSTVSNFLSAQLNQLSSKFVPGVELNFDIQSYDDYTSGAAQGRTQVGIGLKKQLFSERVSVQVGGTVDVEGTKASQNSASDITSDVAIEYKLTKDGRYRLKGFRNTLYEGAIEGQIVETGIGVSYVHDFNSWKDIFRRPKKQK